MGFRLVTVSAISFVAVVVKKAPKQLHDHFVAELLTELTPVPEKPRETFRIYGGGEVAS